MNVVVAALDTEPSASAVLETAHRLGELLGSRVEAVHVREGPTALPEGLARRDHIPLRILEPPVGPALLEAVSDPLTTAAVIGARATPTGRRPVGRTALYALERAGKPIAVVPPEARTPSRFRRLLIPLEGTAESARPVTECLLPLVSSHVDVLVLHVFTPETVPRTLNHDGWDLTFWGDEFVARFCPEASGIVFRSGAIGAGVAKEAHDANVDLIVLSWSQDATPGHAAVVRDVLGRSIVPVLLLPADARPLEMHSSGIHAAMR
jgi:hypothetical protein